MNRNRTWLVAKHEYFTNLRRPAFLFAAFGAPLFTLVVMFLIFAVLDSTMEDTESIGTVGYVDLAGVASDAAAPTNFARYATEDAALAALDTGELGAYFLVPEDYLATGAVQLYSRATVPESIADTVEDFLLASLAGRLSNPDLFERIEDPVTLTVRIQDTGRVLGEDAAVGLFVVPLVFSIVFLMSTQTTSGYLMSGVVEEKANRVMELLITSITPLQLLLGKILGLGALGLTQMVIWLAAGAVMLSLGQNAAILQGVTLSPEIVMISLIYFVLTYFLFAGLMAGIGASAGSEQESRQYAGLFALLLILPPYFAMFLMITEPENPILTALTLIPFTSPLTVLLRMSLGTVPAGELIASLVILFFTTVFVVWGMARVFRWSLLLYGKRPTPRQLWHVIRGSTSAKIGTVATSTEQTA